MSEFFLGEREPRPACEHTWPHCDAAARERGGGGTAAMGVLCLCTVHTSSIENNSRVSRLVSRAP